MKGMREKFVRKLKSISTLKQGLVFEVNPPIRCKEQEHQNDSLPDIVVPCKTTLSEFINHVKDEDDIDPDFYASKTEALGHPIMPVKDHNEMAILSEFGRNNFSTLALPDETQSLTVPKSCNFQQQTVLKTKSQPLSFFKFSEPDENHEYSSSLLSDFEDKCPPGGEDSVILYTTSLRGIRKTFQDCNTIRFLLESFGVVHFMRDVSMHMEFREELWRILGGRVVPPRLFIRGRHIGGADEVVRLHEQGKLRKLLEGIPITVTNCPCHGCAGVRFVLCLNCNGSRKIIADEIDCEFPVRCPECNENGLVQCPLCS